MKQNRFSNLSFDYTMKDLYTHEGILRLQNTFLFFLQESNEELYEELIQKYKNPDHFSKKEIEDFCIKAAPYLEDFISYLFNISSSVHTLQKKHHDFCLVTKVKRLFIQKYVSHLKKEQPTFEPSNRYSDIDFAKIIEPYLDNFEHPDLVPFIDYALWAIQQNDLDSILFKLPVKKTAEQVLMDAFIKNEEDQSLLKITSKQPYHTTFSCHDSGIGFEKAYDQTQYCIKCHPQERDYCSKGYKDDMEKKGCPLNVKVSAMMALKGMGYTIGALAVICIDNPMVAATGHRICNDCRLACIYQRQESVDVPGVESQILKSVLELSYGFEIYSLLTRWNPLDIKNPIMKKETGHHVLVVGQGPSGFGLSHYLIRNGIRVFAIDGLKIEPLSTHLLDIENPIIKINNYFQDLDERLIYGFGGVAEYGITSRWNKNYLFVIRLILERNKRYCLQGGVLFGSQLTKEQAFEFGFCHIALCMGAGSPKMIPLKTKEKLPIGVRFASDFLMALQLTGAFKMDSMANLTIDMPIVVIGGGLTAVDAATEAQRYYLRQIEKVKHKIDQLEKEKRLEQFLQSLTPAEKIQLDRWLTHANQLLLTRKTNGSIVDLLHSFGGTTILYRREIKHAPCVKLNAEEVLKALQEGILIKEECNPSGFIVDNDNHVTHVTTDNQQKICARTVLIAIGTEPTQNN